MPIPEELAAPSPLDIMLRAMRLEASAGNWRMAAALAEKAAPYVHPNLSSQTLNVRTDDTQRSEADLRRELDELERAAELRTTGSAANVSRH